jgi:hypothetical protein
MRGALGNHWHRKIYVKEHKFRDNITETYIVIWDQFTNILRIFKRVFNISNALY